MNVRRIAITAGLTVALVFGTIAPAMADSIAQKQAQAAAAQAKVADLQTKSEMAAENYNLAKSRYSKLTAKEATLRAHIRSLTADQKKLQGKLDTRIGMMYRQGPMGALALLLDVRTIDGFVTVMHAMTQQSQRDTVTVGKLKASRAEAVVADNELLAAKTEAGKQKATMAANAATVQSQYVAENRVYAGLTADVKRLIAEQKAREAAAAAARARAALARERALLRARSHASSSGNGGGGGDVGGNPPVSGRGAKAVWYAEQKLGTSYVWGASGPNHFDCSGLVMWAYRKVGVSLPHHAASQIGHGSRVSRGNLQPGDLVFFGSPIHHVGMYVGGGDFIEAPHSGADVRISRLSGRGDYVGACRP
jgi:cell wall-associated NlpC family hydrolase